MPRPHSGAFAKPDKFITLHAETVSSRMPHSSWWTEAADRETFAARAKQEATRMAGSLGERMVQQLHSTAAVDVKDRMER